MGEAVGGLIAGSDFRSAALSAAGGGLPSTSARAPTCRDYFCPNDGSCIKRPIQAHAMAPWVKMSFPPISAGGIRGNPINPNSAPEITVGNNSNAPNNHAAIKSFIYGASDGNGAEVEIYDEEGGEFDLFVSKVVKVLTDGNDYSCTVEWGWAFTDCDGSPGIIKSSPHHFLILAVDISYSAGGIKFKLELQDLMEPLFETRSEDIVEKLTIKEAIKKIFQLSTPKINKVLFKKFTPAAGGHSPCNALADAEGRSGGISGLDVEKMTDFKFKGALETEKPEKWECKGLTPLGAIREWLKDKMTENDKGTIIFWDSTKSEPTLVILEDPLPKCWSDLDKEQCERSIGTYIVNGGNNSPVLSFDPQIKFNFAAAAKAGAGVDSETAEGKKTPGNPCPEGFGTPTRGDTPPGSGDTTFVQMSENFNQVYGPGNLQLAMRGLVANERANKTYENIEAELRIQGDPTLDNPFTIKVKTISIIVINPFHLRNAGGNTVIRGAFGDCPEWLIGPPCNQILSNKNWFIKGVSHEVKEGSFTTTLKLYLPAPGQTIKA